MVGKYSLEDVGKGFGWLGHGGGWTELGAYQRGRRAEVGYVRGLDGVVKFVEAYGGSRMVCYGLNPRPRFFEDGRGFVRSALEGEVGVSQSLLLDLDFEGVGGVSGEGVEALEGLLEKADGYFRDPYFIGSPVRAFTGRGFHLLFAFEPIRVVDYPDVSRRLALFRDGFVGAFRQELSGLGVRVDRTQDLRRMVRVYGTAKPDVGIVSRFYGDKRTEDGALRDYLLGLVVPEERVGCGVLGIGGELPRWFVSLIRQDEELRGLWNGLGKPRGTDISRSGFDYSLVRALIWRGYRDLDDLATVVALRPGGGAKEKGERYIRRTIASALLK